MKQLIKAVSILVFLFLFLGISYSQPTTMTYQGRLLLSGMPTTGSYTFVVTIYDAITGGNILLGPQTYANTSVQNGIYTITLSGLSSSVLAGNSAYIDVSVNGTNLSPRVQLHSAPYAIMANSLNGLTSSIAELNILDGVTASTADINKLAGMTSSKAELDILTGLTSSTAELNILDGVTATTAEINKLAGMTSSKVELNKLTGLTSTTTELNILNGVVATAAEINKLAAMTSSKTELNILTGLTSSTAELNILNGVTANATEINLLDGLTAVSTATTLGGGSPSNTVLSTQAAIKSYVDAAISTAITTSAPSGTIVAFGGTVAPTGWLLCDGTSYSRATYTNLFTAIGTSFGFVDGTHFNVPDLRGMFLRGSGTNGTNAKAINGNFNGSVVGTYQQDQIQGHYHEFQYAFNDGGAAINKPYYAGSGTTLNTSSNPLLQKALDPATGSNGAVRIGDETKPASISVNYIIKY